MSATPNRFLLLALAALWAGGCSDSPSTKARTEPVPISKPTVPAPQPAPAAPVTPAPVEIAKPVEVAKPAPVVLPSSYAEALAAGREALAAHDLERARALLDHAVSLDAAGGAAHMELARMHLELKQRHDARVEAKRATWLTPQSSAAWNTLGRAELAYHAYDKAVAAFEKAIEVNEKNAFAWNNLGLTYLMQEQWDQAIPALEEAVDLADVKGYMWNNLGLAYEQLDRLDDARMAFEEGAQLGSKAAANSRERLEGVVTLVRAEPVLDVDPDVGGLDEPGSDGDAAVSGDDPAPTPADPTVL